MIKAQNPGKLGKKIFSDFIVEIMWLTAAG